MRWRRKLKMQRQARGTRLKNATTHIKWRKRTARSRISGGDDYGDGDNGTEEGPGEESEFARSKISTRANAEHRHRRAHRRRENNSHGARFVLHRHDPQDG